MIVCVIHNSGHFGPPLPFWLPMASYATGSVDFINLIL